MNGESFPINRVQNKREKLIDMCKRFGINFNYKDIKRDFSYGKIFFIGEEYHSTMLIGFFLSQFLHKSEINYSILFQSMDNSGYTILKEGQLYYTQDRPQELFYDLYNYFPSIHTGNIKELSKFTNKKHETKAIFSDSKDFFLASEQYFSWKKNGENSVIKDFLQNSDTDIFVLKPDFGNGGQGVYIIPRMYLNDNFFQYFDFQNYLIQEKIESFPLSMNNIQYDWNIRTIISYSYDTQSYIVCGHVGRYDIKGIPVNISISGKYASLDDIFKSIGIRDCLEEFTGELENTSLLILHHLLRRLDIHDEIQDLFCLDFILDKDKNLYLLEMDDAHAGCIYHMYDIYGFASIEPIIKCIINRVSKEKNMSTEYHHTQA